MSTDNVITKIGLITYFRASNAWVEPSVAEASLKAHGVQGSIPDLSKRGVSRASFAASHWRGVDLRADVVDRKDDEITIGLLRRRKVSDQEVGWVQFDAVKWSETGGWAGATSTEGREFYAYGTKWQTFLDYHWVRDTVFSTLKRIGIPMGGGGICYVHGDREDEFSKLRGWVETITGAKLYAIKIDPSDPDSVDAIGGSAKDHALTQVADVTDRLNEWKAKARGKTSTLENLLTELTDVRGRALALSKTLRFSTDEVDAAVASAEAELRATLQIATEAKAEEAPKPRKTKGGADAAEIETLRAQAAEAADLRAQLAALQAQLAASTAPAAAPAPVVVEETAPVVEDPVVVVDGAEGERAKLLALIPNVEVLEGCSARDLRKTAKDIGVTGYSRKSEAELVSLILARREELATA